DVSGPFEHVLQAKMSIHYNVAAALRYGNFEERDYAPQQNADVLTIATRTRLEVDDELTKAFPAKQGAEVVVHTRAGDELRERREDVGAHVGARARGCGSASRTSCPPTRRACARASQLPRRPSSARLLPSSSASSSTG